MNLVLRVISSALEENNIRIVATDSRIDILVDESQDTVSLISILGSMVHDSGMIVFMDYTRSHQAKSKRATYNLPKTTYYQPEDPELISKIVDAAKDVQNRAI